MANTTKAAIVTGSSQGIGAGLDTRMHKDDPKDILNKVGRGRFYAQINVPNQLSWASL